jgi:hypothetical protein
MAPRNGNLPNQAAEDTVFENLGLSREELGLDTDDLGSGNEDLDAGGSGNEGDDDDFQLDTRGQQGADDDDQGDEPQRGRGQQESRVSQTEKKPTPFYHRSEVKPDKQGNLVNAEGIIVARKGREARLYQENHKFRGQAQTMQGQVTEVTGRLRKAVEIGQRLHRDLVAAQSHNDAIKQFGIDSAEQLTALRLYKELRDEPAKAIKNILTRAAANGINIAELGATGGADPKSLIDLVRETIGKELNPLRESTAAAAQARKDAEAQTAQANEIQGQVDSFFSQNPDAVPYLPAFTKVIQKFPGMSLGEIWARMQLAQQKNPQLRRTDQNSQRQNGRRRSLPQGRQMPAANGSEDLAPVTDSYGKIVGDALDQVFGARR